MRNSRSIATLTLAAGFLVSAMAAASAQTYPSRPITHGRAVRGRRHHRRDRALLGDTLSQSLGQQIVIENVGGAGGTIGAARAARAAPDGYTILLHQPGLAAAKTLYPNLSYNAEKDFAGIGLINTSASIIAGRANAARQQYQRTADAG